MPLHNVPSASSGLGSPTQQVNRVLIIFAMEAEAMPFVLHVGLKPEPKLCVEGGGDGLVFSRVE